MFAQLAHFRPLLVVLLGGALGGFGTVVSGQTTEAGRPRVELDWPAAVVYPGQAVTTEMRLWLPEGWQLWRTESLELTGDLLAPPRVAGQLEVEPGKGDASGWNIVKYPLVVTPGVAGRGPAQAVVRLVLSPGGQRAQRLTLLSPEVAVEVRALPKDGRPASYQGAVGFFTVKAGPANGRPPVPGRPVALAVEIGGEGNFDSVPTPELAPTEGWRLAGLQRYWRPANAAATQGTLTLVFTIVPTSPQVRQWPGVRFATFDPESGEYLDLSLPPRPLGGGPPTPSLPEGML